MNISSFGRRLLQLADAATFYSITNLFSTANTWTAVQTFSANPSVTGGAITFPATQVPSAGANDLDDYEEGTFTSGVSFGGGTTGITYSAQTGVYTKIGRMVFATGRVTLTSKGSSTGSALITGLPFTIGSSWAGDVGFANGFASLVDGIYLLTSGTTLQMRTGSATGSTVTMNDTHFTNTTDIIYSVKYSV